MPSFCVTVMDLLARYGGCDLLHGVDLAAIRVDVETQGAVAEWLGTGLLYLGE